MIYKGFVGKLFKPRIIFLIMPQDKIKGLKEQIKKEENNNLKEMWKHMNFWNRIIYILGCFVIIWLAYQFGQILVGGLIK